MNTYQNYPKSQIRNLCLSAWWPPVSYFPIQNIEPGNNQPAADVPTAEPNNKSPNNPSVITDSENGLDEEIAPDSKTEAKQSEDIDANETNERVVDGTKGDPGDSLDDLVKYIIISV